MSAHPTRRGCSKRCSREGIELEPRSNDPTRCSCTGTTSERVGDIAFAAAVPVHELVAEGSSPLEEVFLDLTSAEPQP